MRHRAFLAPVSFYPRGVRADQRGGLDSNKNLRARDPTTYTQDVRTGNTVTFVGMAPRPSAIRIPAYLWTRLRASPSPSHRRTVIRVGHAASRSRQNTA